MALSRAWLFQGHGSFKAMALSGAWLFYCNMVYLTNVKNFKEYAPVVIFTILYFS
jgi:hypothetical protein